MWCWSGYLESASQVQFSGSYSQDSGSQGRNFQVPGAHFQRPWCQGPSSTVPCPRTPGLRVSESWGLRSHGPRSRVSGPDFRLCHILTILTCPLKTYVVRLDNLISMNIFFTIDHKRSQLFFVIVKRKPISNFNEHRSSHHRCSVRKGIVLLKQRPYGTCIFRQILRNF